MIIQSADIRNDDINQLKYLELLSSAARAHQYFVTNPADVDALAKKIVGAYKLTDPERKERDDAVQRHKDAIAGASEADKAKKQIQEEASQIKKDADAYAKKIRLDADIYVKETRAALSREQQKVIDAQDQLREDLVSYEKDKKQLEIDQKEVEKGLQKIADWEKEKAEWESDYGNRLEALGKRERKAVKG